MRERSGTVSGTHGVQRRLKDTMSLSQEVCPLSLFLTSQPQELTPSDSALLQARRSSPGERGPQNLRTSFSLAQPLSWKTITVTETGEDVVAAGPP